MIADMHVYPTIATQVRQRLESEYVQNEFKKTHPTVSIMA
jgi:hypothetical protein